MRIVVDGVEGGSIRYGEGILYGDGLVYGQIMANTSASSYIKHNIKISDDFRIISVGSDSYGNNSAKSRMDNIRFSRIVRDLPKDSSGLVSDPNYSSNTNSILPVGEDDASTFLLDFGGALGKAENFATVIDPKYGIFDFTVEVVDEFNKVIGINDGEIEDLIVKLINKLKPAHSNALVKFTNKHC